MEIASIKHSDYQRHQIKSWRNFKRLLLAIKPPFRQRKKPAHYPCQPTPWEYETTGTLPIYCVLRL